MSKAILVTGATGNQGGSVIAALTRLDSADFTILAITRNAKGDPAKKFALKYPSIAIIEGDQNNAPALFAAAQKASPSGRIWGVYSVQIVHGPGEALEAEVKQGKAMIEESIKAGVECFLYSSVDRGGSEESWEAETTVPHFQTKYHIERYLRENAGHMSWTILRPVAFMDNLTPGFPSKVFLAAMNNKLGSRKVQWIAVRDIGVFAAKIFAEPSVFNHKALSVAGDELSVEEISSLFAENTRNPIGPTFGILGSLLMTLVTEVRLMIGWFASDGYKADIASCRELHPDMLDFKTWIKEGSKFDSR